MKTHPLVWSGETYDGVQVVFCDSLVVPGNGFFASIENGRQVARSLGGVFLDSLARGTSLEDCVSWLQRVADTFWPCHDAPLDDGRICS